MRERVVRTAVIVVTVALAVFAVPLAALARTWVFADERGQLERHALGAAVLVGPEFADGDPVDLARAPAGMTVGVYDRTLRLRDGRGPRQAADIPTRGALGGSVGSGQVNGTLVVAVPVTSGENVVGVARAAISVSRAWGRVALIWGAEALLAAGAMLAALFTARRLAATISEPVEALAAASRRVAEGDLAARAASSTIPEIDQAATAHNAMVERLLGQIEAARHFSADASHQLRTPLSRLVLGLEAARSDPDVDRQAALDQAAHDAEQLQLTVATVLELARPGHDPWHSGSLRPAAQIVDEVRGRWLGRFAQDGRNLVAETDGTSLDVPAGQTAQILNALLENALEHGGGDTRVQLRAITGSVLIDVRDEGSLDDRQGDVFARGTSGRQSTGIGLSLSRQLAESIGGRLVLSRRSPSTFTLLLPTGASEV